MKRDKLKNIIFFTNGSIGDLLMVLFFMENIHLGGATSNLIIATPRNRAIFLDLVKKYDYLSIEEVGGRNIKSFVRLAVFTARVCFQKNLVITPPTFGVLPLRTKCVAKLCTLWRGSFLVGFWDNGLRTLNKFLYDELFRFDVSIFYFEMIKRLITDLDYPVVKETPNLFISESSEILKTHNLKEGQFIVVHPKGAVLKRSIVGEDLVSLIQTLLKIVPMFTIIISGSKEDRVYMQKIKEQFSTHRVLILCGELSMNELCTLLMKSKLYIGVDTGPTHIAGFLSVPSVVIAHHGTPNWLPYYNKRAIILYAVDGCTHAKYEGKEHLNECRGEKIFPLIRVPEEVIDAAFRKILSA